MRRRILRAFLLVGGVALIVVLQPPAADAARYTGLEITIDGKDALGSGASDQGELSDDEVWAKLPTVTFGAENCLDDFELSPDETNGNRITLRGDIHFRMKYGGEARLDTLRLVRVTPDSNEWKIPPLELKRITQIRNAARGIVRRPNVVVVICDDLRWNAMSCGGHPHLVTPNIDQLATEGVFFENMFCTTSLCSPSRASILSGLYAHAHGVTNNFTDYPADLPSFPRQLQQAGYETAYIGKWHMGEEDDSPRPGFDWFVTHRGQGLYFDTTFNFNGQQRQGRARLLHARRHRHGD